MHLILCVCLQKINDDCNSRYIYCKQYLTIVFSWKKASEIIINALGRFFYFSSFFFCLFFIFFKICTLQSIYTALTVKNFIILKWKIYLLLLLLLAAGISFFFVQKFIFLFEKDFENKMGNNDEKIKKGSSKGKKGEII